MDDDLFAVFDRFVQKELEVGARLGVCGFHDLMELPKPPIP